MQLFNNDQSLVSLKRTYGSLRLLGKDTISTPLWLQQINNPDFYFRKVFCKNLAKIKNEAPLGHC